MIEVVETLGEVVVEAVDGGGGGGGGRVMHGSGWWRKRRILGYLKWKLSK